MKNKLQLTLIAASLATCFNTNAVVYKIENMDELLNVHGTLESSRSGYGVAANDNGLLVGGAAGSFALQLSDAEQDSIDANPTYVLLTQGEDTDYYAPKTLPTSSNLIFTYDTDLMPTLLSLLEESVDSDTLAGAITTQSYAYDVNVQDIIVGSTSSVANAIDDPDQSDTNDTRDQPYYAFDYKQRGFVVDNGETYTFIPEFSEFGGQSGFTAINDNNMVVGYESVAVVPDYLTAIESNCVNLLEGTIPLEVCTQGFTYADVTNAATEYDLRAVQWEYVNGHLINRTELGILADRLSSDTTNAYNSIALDINNNDIAVGRSIAFRDDDEALENLFNVATAFINGRTIDLMDHSETSWLASVATAINDSDVIVGYTTILSDGVARNKMFIYDLDLPTPEMFFPNDFDDSQTDYASEANDINSDGDVVGAIEIDTVTASSGGGSRTHGFIYSYGDDDFFDINNLLTCNSMGYIEGSDWEKQQYTGFGTNGQNVSYEVDISIAEANKITDDGTIMATALVTLPLVATQWLDENGDVTVSTAEGAIEALMTDSNGDLVFVTDSDGSVETEQVARAVILKPSQETVCGEVTDSVEDYEYERSGAGLGLFSILLMVAGLFNRQRATSTL